MATSMSDEGTNGMEAWIGIEPHAGNNLTFDEARPRLVTKMDRHLWEALRAVLEHPRWDDDGESVLFDNGYVFLEEEQYAALRAFLA